MLNPRSPALAVLVLLAGGLDACGGSAGSGASVSDAPHDASRSSFCRSWAELDGKVSPPQVAGALERVGTPSDIESSARHGFEVLLDHLRGLPQHAHRGDITQMARGLTGTDQQDVAAFVTYYAGTCRGASHR